MLRKLDLLPTSADISEEFLTDSAEHEIDLLDGIPGVRQIIAPASDSSRSQLCRRNRLVAMLASVILGAVVLMVGAVFSDAELPSAEHINKHVLQKLVQQQPALVERLAHIDVPSDRAMLNKAGLKDPHLQELMLRSSRSGAGHPDELAKLEAASKDLGMQNIMQQDSKLQRSSGLMHHLAGRVRKMLDQQKKTEDLAEITNQKKGLKITTCVFHVLQAATYLAEAGSAINSAAANCPAGELLKVAPIGRRRGEHAALVCAVDIEAVFASFGWAAYFLASATSTCGLDNPVADCAAQAIGLPTAFINIAESATAIPQDCKKDDLVQLSQKLEAKKLDPFGHQSTAYCVLDPIQASYWIARAAISIMNSVADCPDPGNAETCAADLLSLISAFGWTGGFIASAASDCGYFTNLRALCTSDVIDLVAAVSMAAGEGIFVHQNCQNMSAILKESVR